MLTAIVQHSEELVAFITALNIVLYQPQMRHLVQLVDALIVCNGSKTISGLYRLLKGQPDPKTVRTFCAKVPGNRRLLVLPVNAGWSTSFLNWPES